MNKKSLLVLLASMVLVVVNVQPVKSQSTAPSELSSPTEQPTPTNGPQTAPISPWVLILLVFTSVGLSAVVFSVLLRLRRDPVK